MEQNLSTNKKHLNNLLWKLALPIILQNALTTALNLIDSLMIGQISQNSSAEFVAVGFANQIFFAISLIMMGLSSAAQVFAAQYYGNNDYKNVNLALGLGILTCGGFSLLMQIFFCIFPEQSMLIFTNDPDVIQLGGGYMAIVSWSYFATGLTFLYSGVLRSVHRVKLPMAIAIIGVIVNTLLNWVLIYGKLGFDAMGVNGAAIATLISRLIQIILILICVYYPKTDLSATLKQLFSFPKKFAISYIKYALPIAANEALWGIGTSIYSVFYGRIGTAAAAAALVAANIEKFAWIIISSLGAVTAIILGNALGRGDKPELLKLYYKQMQKNILFWAIGLGAVIAVFAWSFPHLFSLDPEAIRLSTPIILMLAALIPIKSSNFNRVIGVLRAGGDSTFTCILESLLVWFVSIPLGYIFYSQFNLGILPVFLIVHIDEIIKLPIIALRCKKGKWMKNLTKEITQ